MLLQVFGFLGCAAGLLLASFHDAFTGPAQIALIYAGFMLFNFMCNMGPNAQTYLLAGEVFPTHIRGIGAGFAAAFGKVGAVLTAFLFPILLSTLGTSNLLYMLVATSLPRRAHHLAAADRDQGPPARRRGPVTARGTSRAPSPFQPQRSADHLPVHAVLHHRLHMGGGGGSHSRDNKRAPTRRCRAAPSCRRAAG